MMARSRILVLATLPGLLALAGCGEATSSADATSTSASLPAGTAIEPTTDPVQAQSQATGADAETGAPADSGGPPMGDYAITSEPAPPPASDAPAPYDPTKD